MVRSFSRPLMVAACFAQGWGQAWVRPFAVSVQTKAYIEPCLGGRGVDIITSPISPQLGTPVDVQTPPAAGLGTVWNTQDMLLLH